MASWTEDSWSQNDDVNFGLPYVTATGYAQVPNFNNLTFYWKFEDETYKMPIPKSCQMILAVDYTDVATIFGNNERNYGLPMPITCNQFPVSGAFNGCTNLTSVSVPISTTFIDYYSFVSTGISSITIPPDCFYYANSFPSGCTVSYYNASINRIELNDEPQEFVAYSVGSSVVSPFNDSRYKIIIRISDGGDYVDRVLKNFTITNVDTSQEAMDQTGTINVVASDGTVLFSQNFSYDVMQSVGLQLDPQGTDDLDQSESI